MDVAIKVRAVTRNWVMNVLLLLTVIVLVLVVISIASIHNNYYNSCENYIEGIASSFDRLAVCDGADYYTEARSLSAQFSLKNRVEVQFVDRTGAVIVSTSGFLPTEEGMPDYDKALTDGVSGNWIGYNSNNEHVMASTFILPDYGKGSNGAVRCVVSLTKLDSHIFLIN